MTTNTCPAKDSRLTVIAGYNTTRGLAGTAFTTCLLALLAILWAGAATQATAADKAADRALEPVSPITHVDKDRPVIPPAPPARSDADIDLHAHNPTAYEGRMLRFPHQLPRNAG